MKLGERMGSTAVVFAAQLCPTLCDPMDCSPPRLLCHGILQASLVEVVGKHKWRISCDESCQV